MIDDNILVKVLGRNKTIIGIEKYDTKILIEADDKLPGDFTLKSVVISIISVIKDGDKSFILYRQSFFPYLAC